jgi:ParB family chromosome partitioning protein
MRTRIPIEEGAEEPRRARLKAHFTSNRRRRTMTMQTVSLSSLEPGRGNPRKAMDRNGLEGLADSIRKDGVLQNLVVRPVKGKGQHYRIIAGGRRYRALKLLEERGEVDGDFAVPVEIRASLSKDDGLRIATVENLQRQNLAPLEEAAALTKLIHKGASLDDVAAQTGLSQTTIKRRLALNGLCEAARAALARVLSACRKPRR